MLKHLVKKLYIIIFLILIISGITFSTNTGNIASKVIQRVYPEYTIFNTEFGTYKAELKDFTLLEDGGIISTTVDPWVYIAFDPNGLSRIFSIDIEIREAYEEGIYIYPVESYRSQYLTLQNGSNHIKLTNLTEQDYGLRIDLTESMQKTFYIDKFVFNNNTSLTTYFCSKAESCTLWLIMVFISLLILELANKSKAKLHINERSQNHFLLLSGILVLILSVTGLWMLAFITTLGLIFVNQLSSGKQHSIISSMISWGISIILGLAFIYQISLPDLWTLNSLSDKIIFLLLFVLLYAATSNEIDLLIGTLAYIIVHAYFQYKLNGYPSSYLVKHALFGAMLALNVLLCLSIINFFKKLLGKHLGNTVFSIAFAAYVIANFIKMHYQNSLFSAADLQIGAEIIGIANQYITTGQAVAIITAIIIVLILIVRYRKFLRQYLRPYFSFSSIPAALLVWMLCDSIIANTFYSIGINMEVQYLTNQAQINSMGFGTYTFLEFTGNQKSSEPEGYDKNLVAECETFKDTSTETETQPTVILILAESLFDAEEIPDVKYNKDLNPNLEPLKTTNIISPSYGGRTAAAEFESLTGLSNLFIENDVVPYTTYLNKPGNEIGSLAREFSNNGYTTIAIHANEADYYSRETVYQNMGFDDFISKEDFMLSSKDYLKDGLANDTVFVDKIIETLESTDQPTFIFGASLEGHSPYSNKYDSTEITVSSSSYGQAALTELSYYGQTVYNFDKEIGRLFEYIENTEEPTLVYIYGDHLPPLAIHNETGYLEDPWLRYQTPLYVYSNYCDTSIEEEYISLSQVAPEILRKSGISYSAYFDYIYHLRQSHPITQKNIVADTTSAELQLYKKIQWDFLFGKKYLLD